MTSEPWVQAGLWHTLLMPTVLVETRIGAPIETCFDLARDIGLHCETAAFTQERAVAGKTRGLIGPGESVTFEAIHFGIRQRLTAVIVTYEPPHRFVDRMTKGAFRALEHTHEFESVAGGTLMRDTIVWTSPLGFIGWAFDKLVLYNYMRNFLVRRNAALQAVAEQQTTSSRNHA